MIRKINAYYLIALVLLLLAVLFIGVAKDTEYDARLFIKYRPTFKTTFHSPLGASNFSYNDLTPEKQEEEKAYQDFVVKHKHPEQGWMYYYLIGMLIQLPVTFFLVGWHRGRTGFTAGWLQILLHFLMGKIVTLICVQLALVYNMSWMTLGLAGIILVLNYSILWVIIWFGEKIKESAVKK